MQTFLRFTLRSACLLFITSAALAQTNPTAASTTGTATVTGIIKNGDAPFGNVALSLVPDRGAFNRGGNFNQQPQVNSTYKTTTDASGKFTFTNVPAGRFRLEAQAEAFVGTRSESLTVADGQTVTAPDLTLARGGVITGRVTGSNRPLIAQRITIQRLADDGTAQAFFGGNPQGIETDDRGLYRAYGLPAGKYLVSAGESDTGFGLGGPGRPGARTATKYAKTYHPDAVEVAQATTLEITPGKLIENADIRLGDPLKRYVASGRVVDADSGQPLAGLLITASVNGGRGGPGGSDNSTTSTASGEFTLSGLLPGDYAAGLGRSANSSTNYYGKTVSFQITDGNVTGLTVSVKLGASVSGIVTLEGVTDPAQKARLLQAMVMAQVRSTGGNDGQGGRANIGGGGSTGRSSGARLNLDGTFVLSGLAAGRVTLDLNSLGGNDTGGTLSILRMERESVSLASGFDLADGQQLTGVRIVAAIGNGAIRGQVVVQGALPTGSRLQVSARSLASGQSEFTQINAQGQFRFTGLLPGSYEITVSGGGLSGGRGGGQAGQGGRGGGGTQPNNTTQPQATLPTVKQVVTVTNGVETPASLTLTIAQ